MPRIVLLFMASLFPCVTFAQMPYLQIVQSTFVSGNAASIACPAFNRNTTPGNYLVAGMEWFGTTNLPTVTDSQGNTFTNKNTDPSTASVAVGLATATASGATQDIMTMAVTSGSFMVMICMEVLPNFSLTVDGTQPAAKAYSGTPATATSNAITTAFNNDFIFCVGGSFVSAGLFWTQGTTYKMAGEQTGADAAGMEFGWSGTVGSKTCGFNVRSSSQGGVLLTAFQPLHGSTIDFQSPAALPDAATSVAYQYTMLSTGGTSALTWSISAGALPTGLSISSAGVITGTPTISNNYSFTIQATDGTHTSTQASTMKVTTGFNTPTVVQSKGDGSTATSSALTFTSNVTGGHTILALGGKSSTHGAAQYCTDSLGTPFNVLEIADSAADHLANEIIYQEYFVGVAPGTGADTVTCSSLGGVAAIYELSDVQVFGTENIGAFTRGNSASPTTSTAITTIVPNELLFTGQTYWSTANGTLSAPFTAVNSTFNYPSGYQAITTVTTYTSTFTFTNNTDTGWLITLVGLRPGSNGTVTPPSGRNKGQIL